MDPLTHAIVGMALGAQSGGGITIANGALVAAALGAVAPDLDVVAQFWGDLAYLKQHRGFSHSLPGLMGIALVVGGLLSPFYYDISFLNLVGWAFVGAFSHTILDLFNSYGVQILWPFSRKMYTASLLMIFDPILMALCFTAMILGARGVKSPWLGGIFVIYLGVRWVMRMWATHLVKKRLSRRYYEIKVVTMPSLNSLFKWDFIARVPGRNIVGSVDLLRKRLKILRRLHYIKEDMKKILVNSCLGRHFQQFTPFFHVFYEKHEDKVIGRFVDLRYYVKDRFLHNGTIVMNEDLDVEEAVFQPYSLSRRVYLSE